jgi:predicted nucleic-acid-binding protein
MRAIDTNVVVRILVRDEPDQTAVADAFVVGGAWVSLLVLMETAWVLRSVYERTSAQIAAGIELLLDHETIVVQDTDLAGRARAAPGRGAVKGYLSVSTGKPVRAARALSMNPPPSTRSPS